MEGQLLQNSALAVLGPLLLLVLTYRPIYALYLIPFAMSLSPEIEIGRTGPRPITIRIEDLLLAVLMVKLVGDFIISKSMPAGRLEKGHFFLPMILYSVVLVLATTMGVAQLRVSPGGGFFFVLKMIQFFCFYLIFVYYVTTEKEVRRALVGILVTLAIVNVYGTVQIPLTQRIAMPFEGEALEPNTYGGYLVLLGAILGGLYVHEPKGRKKTIYAILLASCVMPFIFAQSRGSWIAGGAALFTFMVMTKGLQRKVIILAIILLLPFAIPFMPEKIQERAKFWKAEEGYSGNQSFGGTTFDPSTSDRIGGYKKIPDLFVRSPLLGHGVTGAGFFDGHYIRVIVETGLLGVLAFIYLQYAILRYLYQVYRRGEDEFRKAMSLGLFCGSVGLLVHSLGANSYLIVRIMEPYMVLLALLVCYDRLGDVRSQPAVAAKQAAYRYPFLVTAPVGGGLSRLNRETL